MTMADDVSVRVHAGNLLAFRPGRCAGRRTRGLPRGPPADASWRQPARSRRHRQGCWWTTVPASALATCSWIPATSTARRMVSRLGCTRVASTVLVDGRPLTVIERVPRVVLNLRDGVRGVRTWGSRRPVDRGRGGGLQRPSRRPGIAGPDRRSDRLVELVVTAAGVAASAATGMSSRRCRTFDLVPCWPRRLFGGELGVCGPGLGLCAQAWLTIQDLLRDLVGDRAFRGWLGRGLVGVVAEHRLVPGGRMFRGWLVAPAAGGGCGASACFRRAYVPRLVGSGCGRGLVGVVAEHRLVQAAVVPRCGRVRLGLPGVAADHQVAVSRQGRVAAAAACTQRPAGRR